MIRRLLVLLVLLGIAYPGAGSVRARADQPAGHVVLHHLHGARITCYFPTGNPTATGTTARWGEVAVDPNTIPLGAWLRIRGVAGVFHAEDLGGLVIGAHVDVLVYSWAQAYAVQGSGYRDVTWWYG